MTIRRAFADLSYGQMHYRHAGEGAFAGQVDALVLLHPSPVASRQMVRMVEGLSGMGRVLAPDTAGTGDSDPLPVGGPDVAAYATALLEWLDVMGLGRVQLYGMHTGGAIAAELAIAAPDRVAGLVVDGVAAFSGDALADVLAHYAPRFDADLDGAGLQRLFQFCRDQFLFFPWYARNAAARRDTGLPPADDLYGWVEEVLKARTTYPLAYHAAFRWAARDRLPLVGCPLTLACAANDPLFETSRSVARDCGVAFRSLPRFQAADYAAQRLALILTQAGVVA